MAVNCPCKVSVCFIVSCICVCLEDQTLLVNNPMITQSITALAGCWSALLATCVH